MRGENLVFIIYHSYNLYLHKGFVKIDIIFSLEALSDIICFIFHRRLIPGSVNLLPLPARPPRSVYEFSSDLHNHR